MKSRRNIKSRKGRKIKSRGRSQNRIKRTRKIGGMSYFKGFGKGINGVGAAGSTQRELAETSQLNDRLVGMNYNGMYSENKRLTKNTASLRNKNKTKILCHDTGGISKHDNNKETITYIPPIVEETSSGIFGLKVKKEIYKKGNIGKFMNKIINSFGTGGVISKVFYNKIDNPDSLDHTISYDKNNKGTITTGNNSQPLEDGFPRCESKTIVDVNRVSPSSVVEGNVVQSNNFKTFTDSKGIKKIVIFERMSGSDNQAKIVQIIIIDGDNSQYYVPKSESESEIIDPNKYKINDTSIDLNIYIKESGH